MVAVIIFGGFLLGRNQRVYKYRMRVLKLIAEAAKQDIANGRDYKWRYQMLDSVEYNEMVCKFWKPLDSFYSDNYEIMTKFIK